MNENNEIFNLNKNYITSLNNMNIIKEDKNLENKTSNNNIISPNNKIKLSNIAKIDISLDSNEEKKREMKILI